MVSRTRRQIYSRNRRSATKIDPIRYTSTVSTASDDVSPPAKRLITTGLFRTRPPTCHRLLLKIPPSRLQNIFQISAILDYLTTSAAGTFAVTHADDRSIPLTQNSNWELKMSRHRPGSDIRCPEIF